MRRLFILLFLAITASAWTQTIPPVEALQHEKNPPEVLSEYDLAIQRKQWMDRFELAVVEQAIAHMLALERQAQEEMEQKEGEEVLNKIKRYLFIKEYEALLHPQENVAEIKIALLGNSARFFETMGFHEEVLAKLLESIKKQQPSAVFFMGNLTYGLKLAEKKTETFVQLPVEKDIFGKVTTRSVGYYDKAFYQQQLDAFWDTIQKNLGKDVPFYPLPAEHEAVGPDALDIFRQRFPIKGSQVIDSKEMVYTVNIGNAFFIVLSSDYYDVKKNQVVENTLIPPVVDWLGKQLNEEAPKYRFTFVVGNDPAFSTGANFGIYSGLDQNREERNRFWNLLMKHQVLAYFSSNEVLYDRSYRYGVWQLISGGAGATRDIIGEDDTFYHYLLLTIPQGMTGEPTIAVFDLEGKKRDEFVLTRNPGALFDLRIPNR